MKRLALIVSYRNRKTHLKIFVPAITQTLNQHLKTFPDSEPFEYQIFIIEQENDKPFNRGKLNNVGFVLTHDQFDYVCFHDVDMIPIKADYSYPLIPTHLAANVSQFKDWVHQGLAYPTYFGGVTLFNREDFKNINGYSNEYWGYGAEDDDLLMRVLKHGLKWTRRPGIFESLPHPSSSGGEEHKKNLARYHQLLTNQVADESGLSNLLFTTKDKQNFPQYILYSVDI